MLIKRLTEALNAAGIKPGVRRIKHHGSRRYQLPALTGYKVATLDDGSCRVSVHVGVNDLDKPETRAKLLDDISEALESAAIPYDDEGDTILCFED